ncbi:MAG: RNA polymerase sigma-70 factor [Firmicutes bacterium]|nr:RNA polymerase sigma-70 factor [Bacillota bacterium]
MLLEDIFQQQERDWIKEIKSGDAEAFNQIFNLYGERLFRFSYGYLKSRAEAEEVVQEVFLRVWNGRKNLNPDLSFKAYLFKIAFRYIHLQFQKISQEQAYRHDIVKASLSMTDDLEKRIDYQSLLELVDKLIDQLPKRQKEVVIKRKKEGIPVKDIAAELGISAKTVENHLTQALKTLRGNLEKEGKVAGLLFFSIFYS